MICNYAYSDLTFLVKNWFNSNIEGIMRISCLIFTVVAVFAVSHFPAYSQTTDTEQIIALKSEIRALKEENSKLYKLLHNNIPNKERNPLTNCEARVIDLLKRLDTLYALGFSDKHPDVINVKSQIQNVSSECGYDENKKYSENKEVPEFEKNKKLCEIRLPELIATLDHLKSLGFKDRHPDVINVSKQIKATRNQCDIETP